MRARVRTHRQTVHKKRSGAALPVARTRAPSACVRVQAKNPTNTFEAHMKIEGAAARECNQRRDRETTFCEALNSLVLLSTIM